MNIILQTFIFINHMLFKAETFWCKACFSSWLMLAEKWGFQNIGHISLSTGSDKKWNKTNWKIAVNQLVDWVMACCCLSSTPHNTTYETTLTKRGKRSTISLTQLTAEESESDDVGEKRSGRVETVVFATTQLDMLDRVVVFLTRLVNSNEPRYFKQRFQNNLLWGVAVKFSFVYIAKNTFWKNTVFGQH